MYTNAIDVNFFGDAVMAWLARADLVDRVEVATRVAGNPKIEIQIPAGRENKFEGD